MTAHRIAAPRPIDSDSQVTVRIERRHLVGARASEKRRRNRRERTHAAPEGCVASVSEFRIEAGVDDDAAATQLGDRLRARANVERLQDRAHVHLHRALGQPQVAADELVGLALDQQLQHVRLPVRQTERLTGHAADAAGASGVSRVVTLQPPSSTVRTASSNSPGVDVFAM